MIVTHHPLIFSGLKKITPDTLVGEAVIKAIKAGISIYAAHTSADKVIAGVSGAMAARLGLENVRILDEDGDGTGLGTVGDLPEPLTAEEAVKLVKFCTEKLDEAEQKVRILTESADGSITDLPFDTSNET